MSAAPRRRLFVARFAYEGNSFGPLAADLAAFARTEWRRGDDALRAAAGTVHELAAIPAFAERHPDWRVTVSRCASAMPAGPIDDTAFDAFLTEMLEDLRREAHAEGIDAIYLSLHGAAMTRSRPQADLDIVEAVRAAAPGVPIAATFDMHGNLPERLGALLAIGAGYRTHPHLDMRELAGRTLDRLVGCIERDASTRSCLVNTGILLPSINMRTTDGPMRALQALAADAERIRGVLAASVFGGFPYADAAHAGASAMVYTDASVDADGALARSVAARLADALRAARPDFFVTLPSPSDAIARALAVAAPGLVAVTDAADNPYSGGANDTPGLLPALLAAAPTVPCVVASFADAALVGRAREAGAGRSFGAAFGATHGSAFGAAVALRVVPQCFADGRYRGSEGLLTGVDVRCGDTVMLAAADRPNLRIIVTSQVDPGIDAGFYAMLGIDLARERLLVVKGKNHFRAGVGRRCAAIVDADAPGPACLDFTRLPYRHLRLPDRIDRRGW
jgi:microcystin degradation protein MlrC